MITIIKQIDSYTTECRYDGIEIYRYCHYTNDRPYFFHDRWGNKMFRPANYVLEDFQMSLEKEYQLVNKRIKKLERIVQ